MKLTQFDELYFFGALWKCFNTLEVPMLTFERWKSVLE
jgi:hypothetical protein